MKKTKKFLALIFAAVASASLCFAACDSGEEEQGNQTPNTHTHTFDENTWVNTDPEYHWHPATCDHTSEQGSRERHTFTETVLTAGCTEAGVVHRHCDVCGYDADVEVEALGHQLVMVEALAPTCEVDGHTQYFACTRCDYTEGYQIIRHTGEHRYSSEWSHDALSHWHANLCGCGRLGDKAEHTYGEDGTCTECGYEPVSDEALEAIYTFEESGNEYTVTGLQEGVTDTELDLPAKYNGKKVTGVAPYAFEGNTSITKVVIGEWYTSLGEQIFEGCTALESVTLAMSEIYIGDNMFHGCTSLSELVLGGEITWVGRQAFGRCASLKEITLTDACTFIGQNAFRGSGLTSVTVPDAVTTIGTYAFAECDSLETATIGVGVPYFFGGWFMDCPALRELTVPFVGSNVSADDAVTTAFGYFFGMEAPAAADSFAAVEQAGVTYYIPKTLESVTVTGGTIDAGAFDGCSMLKTIVASENTDVRTKTFNGCTAELTWLGHETETSELEVTLTLGRSNAYTERAVRVDLSVTAGAEVTLTVKKGEQEAEEETDYTYDEAAGTIVFHTAGEYTVTATATLGEETMESSATITIVATPPTLTASVSKTNCNTDEELTLSYESNGTVTVAFKKGDEDAEKDADYTYDAETKKLTFLTAGEYTVVFTAERDGLSSTRSIAVTVEWRAPTLSDVTVEPNTVLMGDTATLTFTEETGSEVSYEVKKDGKAAEETTDYTRNDKTFTFKTAGKFTITVKATLHEKTTSKSVDVNVLDPSTLSVVISADKTQAKEGDEITLTATAQPVQGDSVKTETYEVQKQNGSSFENANEEYYTWTDEAKHTKIRFNVEGTYKIIYTVTTEKETSGHQAEVTITVTGSVLELALEKDGAWILAKTNEQKTINYTVTGDTAAYNVAYKANFEDAEINAASEGTGVTVKYATSETVTFTVTYTHKTLEEKVYTLEIPVSFVDDVENAPRFGADPFGGTYGRLLTGTGLQLYYDAKDKSGTAVTVADVSFEVVSKQLVNLNDRGHEGEAVNVKHIAEIETNEYYVIVEDYQDGGNDATGKVTLKLTVTKDGATASSTKEFEVFALANPTTEVKGMNDYVDAVTGGKRGDMNLDVIEEVGNRENLCVTKDGIIQHMLGADWDPAHKMFSIVTDGVDNFQVDLDYKIIKRTGDNTKASFAVKMCTGNGSVECGNQMSVYIENQDTEVSCGYWGPGSDWSGRTLPKYADVENKIIHIRLMHTLSEGRVTWLWQWSLDGSDFAQHTWYTFTIDSSTTDGDIGSPVKAMRFEQERGTFYIGNVHLTNLDAE